MSKLRKLSYNERIVYRKIKELDNPNLDDLFDEVGRMNKNSVNGGIISLVHKDMIEKTGMKNKQKTWKEKE